MVEYCDTPHIEREEKQGIQSIPKKGAFMKSTRQIKVLMGKKLIAGPNSIISNPLVFVRDEEIIKIVSYSSFSRVKKRLPANADLLDYRNCFLLPGLIDTHVHLIFGTGERSYEEVFAKDSNELMLLRAYRNALTHLKAGVTTMRDLGDKDNITYFLKKAIDQNELLGPRLLVAGRPITVVGGHFHFCGLEAQGIEEVKHAVIEQLEAGMDAIKVMVSGGGTLGTNPAKTYYTIRELDEITKLAHSRGKKVAAHCRATESIRRAIKAKVDSIEHAEFLDQYGRVSFDLELAKAIARSKIYICPTLQPDDWMINHLKKARNNNDKIQQVIQRTQEKLESKLKNFSKLLSLGVYIITGTDSLNSFGNISRELELMVKGGMKPIEAIAASTWRAAKALGIENETGTIQVGKKADLLVVKEDPTACISAVNNIKAIYVKGKQISLP